MSSTERKATDTYISATQRKAIENKAQFIAQLADDIESTANLYIALEYEKDCVIAGSATERREARDKIRGHQVKADATKTGILRKTMLLRRELLKLDAIIKG